MTRLLPVLPALALGFFVLPSCTSVTYEDSEYVGESSYQLAEFTQVDGPSEIYELQVEPDGTAYLTLQTEGMVPYQEMGMRLDELDKRQAERRKLRPYSGLLVRSVDPGSPADRAEIKAGDLLLAVNGADVYYQDDYNKIVDALPEGESVELQVAGKERPVRVDPEARTRKQRARKHVALETVGQSNPKPFAGVQLRAMPKQHSRKIYGDDRNAIVICGVILGSPAYLSGLRAGDIIERVDGEPTPKLPVLMRMLRERGPKRQVLTFDVARESGTSFAADVHLEDYSGTTRVRVPVVFSLASSARRTGWEVAWGAIAGYSNSYTSSSSRDPEQHGSYSMFLGLLKFSWAPSGSRTRLLWFISFG